LGQKNQVLPTIGAQLKSGHGIDKIDEYERTATTKNKQEKNSF